MFNLNILWTALLAVGMKCTILAYKLNKQLLNTSYNVLNKKINTVKKSASLYYHDRKNANEIYKNNINI